MDKNILTIATGKPVFVDMAVNLARSFLHWHKGSVIRLHIVTDQPGLIPDDVKTKVNIIQVKPGELGLGFSAKLQLDKLAPAGQTIFIDSDCLIFEDLTPLFDRFKGHAVSVMGSYISEGEWFGNVAEICRQFGIPHIPKFNGGLYYIEKSDGATAVYNTARDLEKRYDEIGFVRLRNRPNDEVLMALAMQLHGRQPIPDDGTIMSDPQACPGGYKIDVINGSRQLINPPLPSRLHQSWYPFERVSPAIVHFLGYYTQHYHYQREAYRLKQLSAHKLNYLSETVALVKIQYPAQIKNGIKNLLRPVYRALFGSRKVKPSQRSV